MRKQNPTPDDIHVFFGYEAEQTGRHPKKPKGVQARLEQLLKESETWVRRCGEVWFPQNEPLIEEAVGASELPDLPDLYAEAIAEVQWVAGCAQLALEKLQKGKEMAEARLGQAKPKEQTDARGPSETEEVPNASDADELNEYFGDAFDDEP